MRAIQQNALSGGAFEQLHPSRPAHRGQPFAKGPRVDGQLRLQGFHCGQGDGGVQALMPAEQGQPHRVERRLLRVRGSHQGERTAVLPRRCLKDGQGLRFVRRGDARHAGFDDAGLFRRNRGEGFAQPALMVKLNVRNHTGQRRDNVGGVQPSAQAGFPDDQVARLLGKILQSHDGDGFEKRGMMPRRERLKKRL
ncbi:MAG: hypothetical protein BWX84_01725 [Verrucomicrobia bacterium ADurb.Bin118]|nr:MAG: hypothetical protein BWX84_01725 [Verrucomicrobia bacterium ADurb.Bin118]